jgi:hypothetical protein
MPPENALSILKTTLFIIHSMNSYIGFLVWARYGLMDLISLCKRSQLREDNIMLYQVLLPAADVILEDHFMMLHARI